MAAPEIEIAKLPDGFPDDGLSEWRLERFGWPPGTRHRVNCARRGIDPVDGHPLSTDEEAAMPEHEREIRAITKKHAQVHLDLTRQIFESYGDPREPWNAFLYARTYNLPVPDWVLGHLDLVGGALLDSLHQRERAPGKKNPAPAVVGAALGFGGKKGVDTAMAKADLFSKQEELALEVLNLIHEQEQPWGIDAARQEIANRRGISLSTVRLAHLWFEAEIAKQPDSCSAGIYEIPIS